jgi:hypothetical protein
MVLVVVLVVVVLVAGLRIICDYDVFFICVSRHASVVQSSLSELWSHNRLIPSTSTSSAAAGRGGGGGASAYVLPAAATADGSSAVSFGFRLPDSALAAAASPDVPASVLSRRRNGVAVGGSGQGTGHRRSSSSA